MSDLSIEGVKIKNAETTSTQANEKVIKKEEQIVPIIQNQEAEEDKKDVHQDVFETVDKQNEPETFAMPNPHRVRTKEYKVRKEKADQMRERVEETQRKQGPIGKAWNSVKNFFGMNNGTKNVEKEITEFEHKKRKEEDVNKRIQRYERGQEQVVDIAADIASYTAAAGCYATALGGAVAAPFTGGASLSVTAAAIAGASAAGAAAKVAVKGGDAALGGREYSLKDGLKDAGTGAINGPLAAATAGVGYGVTKAVGKLGVQSAAQAATAMEQQVVVGLGKATTKATIAEAASYAAEESANVTLTASKEAIKAAPVSEVRKAGEILLGNADKKALQTVTSAVANSTENTAGTLMIGGAKDSIAANAVYKGAKASAQGATFGGTSSLTDYVADGVANGEKLSFGTAAARTLIGMGAGAIFNVGVSAVGEAVGATAGEIKGLLPKPKATTPKIGPTIEAEQALIKAGNSGLVQATTKSVPNAVATATTAGSVPAITQAAAKETANAVEKALTQTTVPETTAIKPADKVQVENTPAVPVVEVRPEEVKATETRAQEVKTAEVKPTEGKSTEQVAETIQTDVKPDEAKSGANPCKLSFSNSLEEDRRTKFFFNEDYRTDLSPSKQAPSRHCRTTCYSEFNRYPSQTEFISDMMKDVNENPLKILNIGVAQGQEPLTHINSAFNLSTETSRPISDFIDYRTIDILSTPPQLPFEAKSFDHDVISFLESVYDPKSGKSKWGTPIEAVIDDMTLNGQSQNVILFNNVLQHMSPANEQDLFDKLDSLVKLVKNSGIFCFTMEKHGELAMNRYKKMLEILKDNGFSEVGENTGIYKRQWN